MLTLSRKNAPDATLNLDSIKAKLSIPARPAAIDKAAKLLQEATARRMAAQEKHIRAWEAYAAQQPGMPQDITRSQVDDIGQEIRPAMDAEESAKQEHARLLAEYDASIQHSLSGALEQYAAIVREKVEDFAGLLEIGTALHNEANRARIKLPNGMPAVASMALSRLDVIRKAVERGQA